MAANLVAMAPGTLGTRLKAAMHQAGLTPVTLARKSASTEMTISNWLNDAVQAEHVKASQLFRIANAVGMDAQLLLLGRATRTASQAVQTTEHGDSPVQAETLRLALQLVAEILNERDSELPPAKQAEAVTLAYELLAEGLPEAKVLRFTRSAIA